MRSIDEVIDVSDEEIGQRLRALRERKGYSREALAAIAEVSPSTIKSIEMGRRSLTLRMAGRLAPLLDIADYSELYGPQVNLPMEAKVTHPAVPAVRKALTAWGIAVEGQAETAEYLRGWVDNAWGTWHTSEHQRTEVGRILPGLLEATHRSARLTEPGTERARILAMQAQAYHLAQAYLAWHGERELVYLTVDRGLTSALDSGQPLAIASSVWYAAHVLRAVGRSDEAIHNLADARALVERELPDASVERAAVMADLWRCSALTRARSGDQSAWADMEHAREIVNQLPDGYVHAWTRVSRILVDVESVMLAVELGEPDRAREIARGIDPESIPSIDRHARHLVEVARGANMEGSPEATLHLLTRAAVISPETVAFTPSAREMAEKLLRTSGATSRKEAEALAHRIGLEI